MRGPSYQSRRRSEKRVVPIRIGCALAALVCIAAAPYEDPRGRFGVTPAPKWKLAPRFGDTRGTRFIRAVKGAAAPASLLVQVNPVPAGSLQAFARAVERADQARITRLSGRRLKLGPHSAMARTYRASGRRIRSYYVEAAGQFFLLRGEVPSRGSRLLLAEIDRMARSFVPTVVRTSPIAGPATRPARPRVAGQWRTTTGVELNLDAEGGFRLGPMSGRYELIGAALILRPRGRPPRTFRYALRGGDLILRSPDIPEPAIYHPVSAAAPATPPSADKAPARKQPTGRWQTQVAGELLVLDLGTDGRFTFGRLRGRWTAARSRLTLTGRDAERVTYRFRFEDGQLLLEGGDLDAPVLFRR